MDKMRIESLRKIEQTDRGKLSDIWDTLRKSDKCDHLGAMFWEQV